MGILDGNDEGRGGGCTRRQIQPTIVRRYKQADDNHAANVEQQDTVLFEQDIV